jgi:hypothetical protein
MLEPDALKGARPVLRGGGAGDSTSLPDRRRAMLLRTVIYSSARRRVRRVRDDARDRAWAFGRFGVLTRYGEPL